MKEKKPNHGRGTALAQTVVVYEAGRVSRIVPATGFGGPTAVAFPHLTSLTA